MIYLLDVNVLVALAWPNHVHHRPAREWFRTHLASGWATCPTTENGFIRVSSNVRVIPEAKSPREAALLLRELVGTRGHVFWPEEASILDGRWISLEKIHTYRQITEAHLLSLALRHDGCLATFDRRVMELLTDGMDRVRAVHLIPSAIA